MWSAIALALGLAMDATAVSAARGLAARRWRDALLLPLLFGGFQAGMAALGWLAGKMLVDAWRGRGAGVAPEPTTIPLALGLALATSIDAAAAGITLPLVPV